MIIFETERLVVRQYTAEDFENFFLLNGNADVMQYIRPVQNRDESQIFFLEILKSYIDTPALGRWAVHRKHTDDFVGSFAINSIPWDKEKIQLGYALIPKFWGCGFATELTVAGLQYFWNSKSEGKIYGVTETPNTASQKVLLKAGFQFENKMTESGKEIFIFSCSRKVETTATVLE